jgi:hypothetical protein
MPCGFQLICNIEAVTGGRRLLPILDLLSNRIVVNSAAHADCEAQKNELEMKQSFCFSEMADLICSASMHWMQLNILSLHSHRSLPSRGDSSPNASVARDADVQDENMEGNAQSSSSHGMPSPPSGERDPAPNPGTPGPGYRGSGLRTPFPRTRFGLNKPEKKNQTCKSP